MPLVGNGIKSEETGKSSITTAFTSLFLGIRAIQIKGNWGKRDFVNRPFFSQALMITNMSVDLPTGFCIITYHID